ncbi:MAG: peptide chain release factor N(5)-glutamine methyltransferase [Clostridiales bacterium]|nr:peptide chain release factor N(5)-glutamine methyltransferase [Clostridiales bacterium]
MTLFKLFQSIKLSLEPVAKEESTQQARLIICHVIKMDMAKFLLSYDLKLSESEQAEINSIVEKRLTGYPLQYIFGTHDFFGLEFLVNESALIPRQDTETLVEIALNQIKQNGYKTILDMCCGSGCICITLSVIGNVHATLSDISPDCIDLSQQNAKKLNASNIDFITSDLFKNITGTFDLITINPPYLTKGDMDNRQTETTFEPEIALFGGTDGLDFYRRIASEYKSFLNSNGTLLLEIGAEQGEAIKKLFPNSQIVKDANGVDRVAVI